MKKNIRKTIIPSEWEKKIKGVPTFTRERAQQVVNQFKQSQNKELAQKILTRSFLHVTVKIAGRYYGGCNSDFATLVTAGNRGLIKAANSYDFSVDYSFLALAVCYIRHEIKFEIQTNPLCRA